MILVTGFEPFGGLTRNPSAEVAEAVAGDDVRAAVLPVDYDAVVPALEELLRDPFDAVILMGVAIGRPQLALERVAINFRDRKRPDNAGEVPADPSIVPGGPAAYFTTLPVDRLCDRLTEEGIPTAISLTAGAYLCNASFYLARHALEARGTPCGFLHLPPTEDLACGAEPVLRSEQVRALRVILSELRS
jgi:pyroglutamyl-peptidase